ncbi:MAG: hypothetical protein QM802_13830 [Agriterribacter sp.]
MCNCGNKREGLIQQHSTTTDIISSGANHIAANIKQVRFEYIGNTALTVTGNVTGKRYRFSSPGEFLQVDLRDVSGLMSIPVLRRALN